MALTLNGRKLNIFYIYFYTLRLELATSAPRWSNDK